ncbi:MAG: pyroglutamyl-peptidase I [Bacillota bacterium]
MKGKLLVTGFEPFGGDEVNPSMEIAKSLDGIEVSGYQVVARVLPVEWGTVKERVEALMDEIQPAIILSLGLAVGRSEISVEKVAVNYTSKSKDNAGVVPVDQAVVPGAADAYFATIPAEQVVDDVNKKGMPARLSLTAGAYLCNYAFYCASRYAREKGGKTLVGFIHIPATPSMMAGKPKGGPSMAEGLVRDGIVQALTTSTLALTNCG